MHDLRIEVKKFDINFMKTGNLISNIEKYRKTKKMTANLELAVNRQPGFRQRAVEQSAFAAKRFPLRGLFSH